MDQPANTNIHKRPVEDVEAVEAGPSTKTPRKEDRSAETIIAEIVDFLESEQIGGKSFCSGSLNAVPLISCPEAKEFECTYPLKETQFNQLFEAAAPAPYGKDDKTVIDESVRVCRQLDPEKFQITNKHEFEAALQKAVATLVHPILTPYQPTPPRLELYKVLLYGKGSFFKTHQDTPRGEGHIGSIVVVPPCKHTGGELRVQHNEDQQVFNFSSAAKKKSQFVAFFADCEHEITQLTKGFRMSFVYHMFYQSKFQKPKIDNSRLVSLINELVASDDEDKPLELCYFLEHKYPAASLNPSHLKGKDFNFYSLVSPFHPRLSGLDLRFTGMGSSDSEKYFSFHSDVDDMGYVEIDELDLSKKSKEKGVFPARSIFVKGDVDEQSDTVGFLFKDSVVQKTRQMKKIDGRVHGTGNEGCTYAFRYIHGAIFIPITGAGNTDKFTEEHYKREFEMCDGW